MKVMRRELEPELADVEQELARRELSVFLSGKYDRGNALLAINSGAGGTDSQDWAAMLQRMYLRWCERRGFQTEILDFSEGEEAGIKSCTIAVTGLYAYGYLRPEKGVHVWSGFHHLIPPTAGTLHLPRWKFFRKQPAKTRKFRSIRMT